MSEKNPNEIPPLAMPTRMLELEEFLFSETSAKLAIRKINELRNGDGTPQEKEAAAIEVIRTDLRKAYRLHRFLVFNFLLMNGTKLPIQCLIDPNHPEVGEQTVDKPT